MRKWPRHSGRNARLVWFLDRLAAIPDEGFYMVFPDEPGKHARAVLEELGVTVLVTERIEKPRVFTPAEFERFLAQLRTLQWDR